MLCRPMMDGDLFNLIPRLQSSDEWEIATFGYSSLELWADTMEKLSPHAWTMEDKFAQVDAVGGILKIPNHLTLWFTSSTAIYHRPKQFARFVVWAHREASKIMPGVSVECWVHDVRLPAVRLVKHLGYQPGEAHRVLGHKFHVWHKEL